MSASHEGGIAEAVARYLDVMATPPDSDASGQEGFLDYLGLLLEVPIVTDHEESLVEGLRRRGVEQLPLPPPPPVGGHADPIRAYLLGLGLFPLEGRGGDVARAKRIQAHQGRCREQLLSTRSGLERLAEAIRALMAGHFSPQRTLSLEEPDEPGYVKDALDRWRGVLDQIEATVAEPAAGASRCEATARLVEEAQPRLQFKFFRGWARDWVGPRENEIRDAYTAWREEVLGLTAHNLRLAVSVAKRFRGRGPDFRELLHAANHGLVHAARKYHWEAAYPFSTYASHWILLGLARCLHTDYGTLADELSDGNGA